MDGLFQKYCVTKRDGSPVDPDAVYFVLRLDTDAMARVAARAYARSVRDKNPKLADGLIALADKCWEEDPNAYYPGIDGEDE